MDHPSNQVKLDAAVAHRIAQAVMLLIIVLNGVLALSMAIAANSPLASALNSQNVYILAGFELVVLFGAYIAAKYEPIPTPA
ncbi:MAG: hypothetical protein AB8C02_13215 [Halioglobus sp.]